MRSAKNYKYKHFLMNKMPKVDSLKTSHNPTYSFGIHEKPFFHYSMAFLTMAIFIMSLFALIYTIQLKKAILPETVNVNEFLKSLTSHPEMKSYLEPKTQELFYTLEKRATEQARDIYG